MRPHSLVTSLALTAVLAAPASAFAQDCPPGGWFCDQPAPQAPPPPPPAPPAPPPAPPPPPVGVPMPGGVVVQGGASGQVILQAPPPPPATTVIIVAPGQRPPPPPVRYYPPPPPRYYPAPPPPRYMPVPIRRPQPQTMYTRVGINLRMGGAFFGDENANPDAFMFGAGGSIKYRPIPWVGIEAGIDVFGGTDYNGFSRIETPFSLNGLVYFNPQSRVNFYALGGMHLSHAWVNSSSPSPLLQPGQCGGPFGGGACYGAEYDYFGGQLGLGTEFRMGQRFGMNAEVIGFIRGRTDGGSVPEFRAPDGRTTDTSGGLLARLGINFWL